jgi:hypothetical protein
LETHPQLGGDVLINRSDTKNQMENLINTMQRWIATSGMSLKTLAPSVSDPTPHIDKKIEAICVYIPCPQRVFMGSERGQLASGQDDSQFNDELRSRQHIHITPRIICAFTDRCIMCGILPEPGDDGYVIEWPDLDSLGEQAKATLFLTLVQGLAAAIQGGIDQMYTPRDILTKLMGVDEEQADAILDDAAKAVEDKMKEDAALADKHGMVPEPPEGFQNAPQPPPPAVGQPGGPPVTPIKVKPGEQILHPVTGQPMGAGGKGGAPPAKLPPGAAPPVPKPPAPPKPAAPGVKPKQGGAT